MPKDVSPEAFTPALKVLIALINTDELRCKAFVDVSFVERRDKGGKKTVTPCEPTDFKANNESVYTILKIDGHSKHGNKYRQNIC